MNYLIDFVIFSVFMFTIFMILIKGLMLFEKLLDRILGVKND